MSVIFTGLRANNDLHLGNYLGAIRPMVELSKQLGEDDMMYMFIPDLHSFTTPIDHAKLYEQSLNNVKVFLAAGLPINNEKIVIFRQSMVTAHSELAWILSCFSYFGEASRMTAFKDKKDQVGNTTVSVGLFNYPILMAADILLYGSDYIPVGDDQKQHLELARTLATRFNNQFGDIFSIPKPWNQQLGYSKRDVSVRVRSLTKPEKKMSKSVDDPKGKISLMDDPAEVRKKIMSATTDSESKIYLDFDKKPGVSNLLQIKAYLSDQKVSQVAAEWNNSERYGDLKKDVADTVVSFMADFQDRYERLDDRIIEDILATGEAKANKIALERLLQVQKAIGLRR